MGKGTVVITGASSGIGYHSAIEFATRGYDVIAGARRLEPMKPLEKEYGVKIIELDVTSIESVKQLTKLIESEYDSKVKFLFNNAGQPCSFPAIDVTDEAAKQCYEVNVFGAIRMTRELSKYIINEHGTIGFTGSVSGLLPFPFSSIYSSSKAAIHSFADTIALELEPFNVKVVNIITGGVKTSIADKRPLPKTSLYQTEGIEEVLNRRRQMAIRNNPMSAEEYARRVANDFENSQIGKIAYYEGAKANSLKWLSRLPRFIISSIFKRVFGLNALYTTLRSKFV